MDNSKIDLRIIKTKKTLYNTLEELMKEKVFEEIKVSDICAKALINRSTFYSHYEDKYDLLSEYIDNLKDELENELDKNKNINNSKEYYMEMIRLLLDHIEDKKSTYLSIMINNKNSILIDIIEDAINKNILDNIKENNNSTVPNIIIAKFYLGGVVNICLEWLKYDNKYSKEEIINYIDKLIPSDIL